MLFYSFLIDAVLFLQRYLVAPFVVLVVLCASVTASELPQLKLMSPLSSVSLRSLEVEADSAYASKQLKAAQDGFRTILELDPGNRRAMFRLGNTLQQLGNTEQAMSLYRQVSAPNEFSQVLDEFGEKALINIALLASEQLRSALDELEKRKPGSKDSAPVQRLVDDLNDGQKTVATRVAAQQKNQSARKVKAAPELSPPEVINGSREVKHSIKPAPRVTYSQLADPAEDLTEITYIKGAPVKLAKPKDSSTRTVYRKVVQRNTVPRDER
jgi:tetratricopeptide (TPR) repeat protein